jgi:transcriptional antiterminator
MGDYDIYTNTIKTPDGNIKFVDPTLYSEWASGILSDLDSGIFFSDIITEKIENNMELKDKYRKMNNERVPVLDQLTKGIITPSQSGGKNIPIFNFNPIRSEKTRGRSVTPRRAI